MTVNGQEEAAAARPAPCSAGSGDCPTGSNCMDGGCVATEPQMCKEDINCPYNQYCALSTDNSTKFCTDACRQCDKGYISCTVKEEHKANCTYATTIGPCATVRCASGSTCIAVGSNAMCVPNCTYDRDCLCHQTCVNKTCRDPCLGVSCPRDGTCRSLGGKATCVEPVKCSSDSDCPNNQICLEGDCTSVECLFDEDCDDNKQCYYAHGTIGCFDPCDLVRMSCPNGFKQEKHQCQCA